MWQTNPYFNLIRHTYGWGGVDRGKFSAEGVIKRFKVIKPVDFGYGKNFRTAKDGTQVDDQLAAPNVGDIIEGEVFTRKLEGTDQTISGVVYTKVVNETRCGGLIPMENLEELKSDEANEEKSEEENFLWMPKKTGQLVAGIVAGVVVVGTIILIVRKRNKNKKN